MTTETMLTTDQVAKRFYQLAQAGKWYEIQDELFSENASSIEPATSQGLKTVTGLDAIKKKGKEWDAMIEEVYGGYCNEPQVAGNFFVCAMGVDCKMKGQPRGKMDEIALYEVRDGRIISEQFFF
jgi:hypothetical protein